MDSQTPPRPPPHSPARDRTRPRPAGARAAGNEPDCAAERATAGGRLTCLAARGHAGTTSLRRRPRRRGDAQVHLAAGPRGRPREPARTPRRCAGPPGQPRSSAPTAARLRTELDGTRPTAARTWPRPAASPGTPARTAGAPARADALAAVLRAVHRLAAAHRPRRHGGPRGAGRLRRAGAMSRLSSYDSARFLAAQALLSHQLRAVLARSMSRPERRHDRDDTRAAYIEGLSSSPARWRSTRRSSCLPTA